MPSVKVTAGTASVELEAAEISVDALGEHAVKLLAQAHQIEQDANRARADQAGGAYA